MGVGWYKPQAVFISNVHKSTMKDTLIDFLETKTQMDVKQVLPGNEAGSFLVYVNGIIDLEKVQEICNQRPLTGNILQMSQIPITSSILVRNVPPQIDCEVIKLYFENTTKSSGGDTSSVKQLPGNIYLVTFENQSDVTAVCNREHTLFSSKLEVTPMESSVISEAEIFEHTEVQMQSVLHLQLLVKHKTIVEDQLKFTAQVIWAESQGNKLRLKHKKGSKEETHKILTDLIETVTVEKLDIPEAIFEEVKEEIENMGGKQSVFFDRESHSGVIMGFSKSEVDALKETVSDIIKSKCKTEEIALEQYQIDLLSANDFHNRMENAYSGLNITYPNGKIAFNGYSSQIRDVQLNMYRFLNSIISSITYLPSNACKIINNPRIRCYLLDKIKEKNCVGSWETRDDVPCYLHSTCDESINEIDAIIRRHLNVLLFDKNNERIQHFFKVKSNNWEIFLNKIEKEFKGLYYIDEGERSLITYDEVSQRLEQEFDDFWQKNIKDKKKIVSERGHFLFLKELKGDCISGHLDSVKVSFNEDNKVCLSGSETELVKAENYIEKLIGDIQSQEEIFDFPSFGKFLKTSEGERFLTGIKQRTFCVILMKDDEAIREKVVEVKKPVGVCLMFYAEQQKNIQSAIKKVKEYERRLSTKYIKDDVIVALSDSKITTIRDIETRNDVSVHLNQPERTITIHGRPIDVFSTAVSILELLMETQSEQLKMMVQQMAQWYQISDGNPSFKAVHFTADMNFEIEKAFDRKQKCVTINEMQFNIDDCNMYQLIDSVKVKIVRNSYLRKKDLPEHWSPMSSNENLLMVKVEEVEEYNSVKASFTKGLLPLHRGRIEIEKIERIQNRKLYSEYQDRLELTKLKNARNIRNETKSLWHVARYQIGDVKEWESDITKEGFSHSKHKDPYGFSLGDGIWFADSGWSVRHSSTKKSSFLCSVIIGTCCEGSEGLKRLPKSDNEVQYDSAVNRIHDPTDYCIFNGRQILPKYLVTYKK